jgi:pre-mRNA-splicing factor SYF1
VGCRVLTVRDFTTVFDAYAQCEESLLTARIAMMDEDADDEEEEEKEV